MENEFEFIPKIGMITEDSYLHGIGQNEDICLKGVIEFVGKDYFVLRNDRRVITVSKESYWVIEENDFIK